MSRYQSLIGGLCTLAAAAAAWIVAQGQVARSEAANVISQKQTALIALEHIENRLKFLDDLRAKVINLEVFVLGPEIWVQNFEETIAIARNPAQPDFIPLQNLVQRLLAGLSQNTDAIVKASSQFDVANMLLTERARREIEAIRGRGVAATQYNSRMQALLREVFPSVYDVEEYEPVESALYNGIAYRQRFRDERPPWLVRLISMRR